MRVRTHNDLEQWLKYFLTGIIETTKNGVETFNGIFNLQKELDIKLKTLKSREGNARRLLEFLYKTCDKCSSSRRSYATIKRIWL